MKFTIAPSRLAEKLQTDAHNIAEAAHVSPSRRWINICEWVLTALLLVQIGARTAPKAWHTLNTDFPNYYLTARLTHERYDLSRIYEWIWLQRQRDHHAIDQRIVEMVPITPFSTLAIYPFASVTALTAKHCWLILNFGLLIAALWFLRSLTGFPWRRILLIAVLSLPLRVNFMLGQYYVLLLFLLTLSCLLYIRQRRFIAGFLIGIAGGLKIFPLVYLLFFLRKRDWRAFAGGITALLGSLVVSILVFGRELNRVYLVHILPSVFRGEAADPYNLQAASISSLLHRLFIYEPQLNPHPALNLPWVFSVLHPLLQMAVLAPALLFTVPGERRSDRVQLEWAVILLASLTISTSATSYLMTLLILPVALIWNVLEREGRHLWGVLLLLLYVVAGFVGGRAGGGEGWAALLFVPRLYLLILLTILACVVLFDHLSLRGSKQDRTIWGFGLLAALILSVGANLRHQRGLYADYEWRIPEPKNVFISAHPVSEGNAIQFVSLLRDGYHSAMAHDGIVTFSDTSDEDRLGIAAINREHWIEQVSRESSIWSTRGDNIRQGESPVVSADGQWLAFLRENHGRARIWVRALERQDEAGKPVTPPDLNVLEMSFLPGGSLIFAATSGGHPALFLVNQAGSVRPLDMDDARYPSVSPDGQWLAYSQLQGGNWNLWLRNLHNGQTERLTRAACNDTEPAWVNDSRTLIYASDCGRGLLFSALCRRRVVP
jgi:Glycosyltransferase family 87/WD40-like Beta Propeller Repeat